MAASEDTFARLVSLAVHDLRTPLATFAGFARTLQRAQLPDPNGRYLEIMVAASDQLAELLDDVGLAARIQDGRWEPNVQQVDTIELARAAADGLETAAVEGSGGTLHVDRDAATRALHLLGRCALRHGGIERITFAVSGDEIAIAPITETAAPVLLGESMRDLGAAVAARIVGALGGSISLDADRLVVRLHAS
jgi:signal transduction histidine kinase